MSDDKRETPIDTTESETPGMRESSMHGNRETPEAPLTNGGGGRSEKATGPTSDMYATGESDGPIVPRKRALACQPRSPWREGVHPRGTPTSKPRTEHRVGNASRSGWKAYALHKDMYGLLIAARDAEDFKPPSKQRFAGIGYLNPVPGARFRVVEGGIKRWRRSTPSTTTG